jgi:hypothetical protein
MIGAGCGIGEHNLSQHSVKWCEKSGLAGARRVGTRRGDRVRRRASLILKALSSALNVSSSVWARWALARYASIVESRDLISPDILTETFTFSS